jgi:alkanesulfonate monooxygenase SsuD/methylene tetrahydromethanopterin reductase-like flavin-dependent oxidoreductase (luciferase family)
VESSAAQSGHTGENVKVSVGAFGLIAPTKKEAMERFNAGWHNLNIEMGKLRGWPAPERSHFDALVEAPRAY